LGRRAEEREAREPANLRLREHQLNADGAAAKEGVNEAGDRHGHAALQRNLSYAITERAIFRRS